MNSKPYNVLSIDWDYFIDAPIAVKAECFPDGGNENLPSEILNYIWASKYAENKSLKDIPIDTKELAKLRILLKKWVDKSTRVVVVESHKELYEYLKHISKFNVPCVELYHIDFHHDVYKFTDTDSTLDDIPDCGNWLRLVKRFYTDEKPLNCHWIRRQDSELSDCDDLNGSNMDINDIPTDNFLNFVFVCRSGVWSPPHLDSHFINTVKLIDKKSNCHELANKSEYNRKMELLCSRYNSNFKNSVDSIRELMETCKKLNEQQRDSIGDNHD